MAVIMLRKNLMICVTVFAAQYGIIAQTVFGILVCFVALLLQLEKKPYKSDLLDALETWSLICCIATLQLGMMLVASHDGFGNAQYSEALVTTISLVLVLLHVCYMLFWFISFVPQARQMSGDVLQQNSALWQRLPASVKSMPTPKEVHRVSHSCRHDTPAHGASLPFPSSSLRLFAHSIICRLVPMRTQ
jgi:membrane-associated HD superfamily phosphohydrolase